MFVKTSSAKVLGCSPKTGTKTATKRSVGSFEYVPNTDGNYLYVAARACTADVPNLNYDMLPHDELKTAYQTFIGSPIFLNHDNQDTAKARGVIIDAKYHQDDDDKWVEILCEMDEDRCPKLCSLIRTGDIDTMSMGCTVETTTCSICGNVAEYPYQYCDHIQQKGREYQGQIAYEICDGIEFFEESWVYDPADPTAYVQGIDVRKDDDFSLEKAYGPEYEDGIEFVTQNMDYWYGKSAKRNTVMGFWDGTHDIWYERETSKYQSFRNRTDSHYVAMVLDDYLHTIYSPDVIRSFGTRPMDIYTYHDDGSCQIAPVEWWHPYALDVLRSFKNAMDELGYQPMSDIDPNLVDPEYYMDFKGWDKTKRAKTVDMKIAQQISKYKQTVLDDYLSQAYDATYSGHFYNDGIWEADIDGVRYSGETDYSKRYIKDILTDIHDSLVEQGVSHNIKYLDNKIQDPNHFLEWYKRADKTANWVAQMTDECGILWMRGDIDEDGISYTLWAEEENPDIEQEFEYYVSTLDDPYQGAETFFGTESEALEWAKSKIASRRVAYLHDGNGWQMCDDWLYGNAPYLSISGGNNSSKWGTVFYDAYDDNYEGAIWSNLDNIEFNDFATEDEAKAFVVNKLGLAKTAQWVELADRLEIAKALERNTVVDIDTHGGKPKFDDDEQWAFPYMNVDYRIRGHYDGNGIDASYEIKATVLIEEGRGFHQDGYESVSATLWFVDDKINMPDVAEMIVNVLTAGAGGYDYWTNVDEVDFLFADGVYGWPEGEDAWLMRIADYIADRIDYENTMNVTAQNYSDAPRAPEDVDSKGVDDTCPLCGSDSYDGEVCSTCGYEGPSAGFDDIAIDFEVDEEELDDEFVDESIDESDETADEFEIEDVEDNVDEEDEPEEEGEFFDNDSDDDELEDDSDEDEDDEDDEDDENEKEIALA